jgi:hypothetical protein
MHTADDPVTVDRTENHIVHGVYMQVGRRRRAQRLCRDCSVGQRRLR